jgi:hypothetical protein
VTHSTISACITTASRRARAEGFTPAASSGVVRARSHLQHPAGGLDSELVAVGVDVVDHHLCERLSSAGRAHTGTPVILFINDLDIRVVNTNRPGPVDRA